MLDLSAAVASPFEGQSPEARAIATLFTQTLVVCGVIFAVVTLLVAYCVVAFRARDGAKEPPQIAGHTRLEITWTIIPLLIVIGLFVLTARAMAASDPPADRAPDMTVVGHQWWWEVRYPSGAVTANEIHMPTGTPWLVDLQTDDVIHDFWVAELGRKIDMIPGHPSHVWLEADQPGTYLGACAEYCGSQHAWMRIRVVAQSPADFEAWQRHELEPPPPPVGEAAARGAALFRDKTCVDCHAIGWAANVDRARIAPDLTHVAERATLAAGLLDNTPDDLGRWLASPQSLKPSSHMPSLQLTPTEVGDLVTYFETLR
jgi:cytochrome c oxidase subunit 2